MPALEPLKLLADSAPLSVAHAVEQLLASLAERRPRWRHVLFDLCIVVEALLRFLCSAAIAELCAKNKGRLPDKVSAKIRSLILAPTMASWKEILRALVWR